MICKSCAEGAEIMNSPKVFAGLQGDEAVAGRVATAEARHALCKGSTWCDCQHRTNEKTTPDPLGYPRALPTVVLALIDPPLDLKVAN
jgi:hypothetical protein